MPLIKFKIPYYTPYFVFRDFPLVLYITCTFIKFLYFGWLGVTRCILLFMSFLPWKHRGWIQYCKEQSTWLSDVDNRKKECREKQDRRIEQKCNVSHVWYDEKDLEFFSWVWFLARVNVFLCIAPVGTSFFHLYTLCSWPPTSFHSVMLGKPCFTLCLLQWTRCWWWWRWC